MANFYVTHLHLQKASNCSLTASRCSDEHVFKSDVRWLRRHIECALSGCDAGADDAVVRETLLAVIETAIMDSRDLDSTDRDAAENVLLALLDNVAPMPVANQIAAE